MNVAGRVLATMLSAVLVLTMSASPSVAQPATKPSPPRGSDGTRNSLGELTAPDEVSARVIARLTGERVEVVGARTEMSSTWALPDGTMSSGIGAGPIWVRTGGTGKELADWSEVDVDLVQQGDGTIKPKSHPANLVFAGGSVASIRDVVRMSNRSDTESVIALGWDKPLPAPRIDGPRAIYADTLPGIDLILEATRTGFEQYFVVKERPTSKTKLDLSLPVRVAGKYAIQPNDGGSFSIAGSDGKEVARAAVPEVWDANLDAAQSHPVTKPWIRESSKNEVLLRSIAEQPAWKKIEVSDANPKPAPERKTMPERRVNPFHDSSTVKAGSVSKAGRASADVTDLRAVPKLPLEQSAVVKSKDEALLTLGVGKEFLADPDTQFPVVIDPAISYQAGFDTWVSTEWANTDKSNATFLRIGGVPGSARSFITFDVGATIGKHILEAKLSLWETYSWSCSPRNWELWDAGVASTSTRWGAQPPWGVRWATSSETTGYSSACADGWVSIDARDLVQTWAWDRTSQGGLALKAENESDAASLKEMNSANASSNVPTLWVRYNTPPDASTDLNVTPGNLVDGVNYTNSATPTLWATGRDADGDPLTLVYRLHNGVNGPQVWDASRAGSLPGVASPISVSSNGGLLHNGMTYGYLVHAMDSTGDWNSANSGWRTMVVDLAPPPTPVSITSSLYKSDGSWNGDQGVEGTFTVAAGSGETNPHGFLWGLDSPPLDTQRSTDGVIKLKPPSNGRHVLNVRAIDKAGNVSPVASYIFNVGRGGLVSPSDGTRVVRRVRLAIDAVPALTQVSFEWRRGPESVAVQPVPLTLLSTAAGAPFTQSAMSRDSIGSYATLDAGQLLGFTSGPMQLRASLSDGSSNSYATPWINVIVDLDADGAASTAVGPGSVNLVTGDYTVSASDADEFGLAVGRTASSRDPRAGFQPQRERLTAAQSKISGDLSGFGGVTTFARVTDRGHAGNDALRVDSMASSVDSYVAVGGDLGGMRLGMRAGRTYRVSGWIYVPSSTGLSHSFDRALRLTGFYRKGGTYVNPDSSNRSGRPLVTDAWQYLTFDFDVPEGATEAFVRLYNGVSGGGKPVYFDDLSVKEIWAPLGPQWQLGTGDAAADTAYQRIQKSDDAMVTLYTAGGGEVWFTAAGDGRWVPELGAEALLLVNQGNTWTLTELDGTVSTFEPTAEGGPAWLKNTAPPAAKGQTRMVYETVDDVVRLARIIGPLEPGTDDQTACNTAGTPKLGCEITQLSYSAASTVKPASGAVGDYPNQLSKVSVWSSNPDTRTMELIDVVVYRYDSQGRLVESWDPRVSPSLKTAYSYDAAGRVVTLTPAGELPWRFTYGAGGERVSASGDLIDSNAGRLISVTRASLAEGSVSQLGPDNTSTVLYGVPLTRAAGGPYDLDAAALATWAQQGAPTDATAVFGPQVPPAVTAVSPSAPGADGYAAASVHYLDASGREVNTASPIGGDGVDAAMKQSGYIDSAEFDRFGNTTRTLDATNRLLALGLGSNASADLAELNLTVLPSAERALRLSGFSTYSSNGVDVLTTIGPVQSVQTAGGLEVVRLKTVNTYDEGKPDAREFHLVTSSTTSATRVSDGAALDAVTTVTGYSPSSALGGASGWDVKRPTSVTVGQGSSAISSYVKYDETGRTVASRRPSVPGVADWTTESVYYTAGTNTVEAACGNKPEWAGQACLTRPVAAIQGADASRMGAELPVKRIKKYSRYGSPLLVEESATALSVTQVRTTTTTLDSAERTVSVKISATNTGAGAAVDEVRTEYDPASGHAVASVTYNSSGAKTGEVRRQLDVLGRTLKYTDATGAYATSVYDRYGQPKTYTEYNQAGAQVGSRSFTYDLGNDPRGVLTSVQDSVAGVLSASYGADGELLTQNLPGGVRLEIDYDATRTPRARTYKVASTGQVIASSAVTVNTKGKWATHSTTASTSSYTYDAVGRLIATQQAVNGTCTWRQYDFNARSDRTAKRSKTFANRSCPDIAGIMESPEKSVSYSYDSADRLVADTATTNSPWAYDALGRMTAFRSALDPGVTVNATYYDNDRLKSQSVSGGGSMVWSLDPLGRFSSFTSTPTTGSAVTKVNHYSDDGDSPTWVGEDSMNPASVTRYVQGLDGRLALSTGLSGGRVLNLVDLHGDVMATLPVADGDAGAAQITSLVMQASDEYGVPLDLNSGGVSANAPPRYGYLGGAQRSAESLGGTILMGARVYQPEVGRFTSLDPTPGGAASEYDYCFSDPVNNSDITGNWPDWGAVLSFVAKAAEVVATIVPGPIGTAAGFISAGAYLATGNTSKALEMGITATAQLVGAGAIAKVATKVIGKAASIGRKVVGAVKEARAASSTRVFWTGGYPVAMEAANQYAKK